MIFLDDSLAAAVFQVAVVADAAPGQRQWYDLRPPGEHECPSGAQEDARPDGGLVRVEDEADHIQRLLVDGAHLPRLQLDVQLVAHELGQAARGHLEVALVVAHEQDVVHVEQHVVHEALVRHHARAPVHARLAQALLRVVVSARGVVVGQVLA